MTLTLFICSLLTTVVAQGVEGYYRYPAVHGNTVYFSAEGDIWRVNIDGGLAQRLTTHPGMETHPAVSPDGSMIAFTGTYEGPSEVYTMPAEGGLPTRHTFDRETSRVRCWTPDGKVVYATTRYSTLPNYQLVTIDLDDNRQEVVPLHVAEEGYYGADGTVYFVNPAFHGNVTKRYMGGTARQIWKFAPGAEEAVKLTTDYAGESHHPMWWDGRVYFISDRDGIMNIWSMSDNGGDLEQHTSHKVFDVREADLHNGVIVYRHGADLWKLNISSGENALIPIRLVTDLDQLREKWEEDPFDRISSVRLDSEGDNLVLTARGRVFVAPAEGGRLVQASRAHGVRYRDAVFSADGESIIVLSDESGEFEFVSIPANGIGEHQALSDNGKVLRYAGHPSPDGKWLAYDDLFRRMWLMNIESGDHTLISTNQEGIGQIRWSPDSKWVAFAQDALNSMSQIHAYDVNQFRTDHPDY